MTHGMGVVVVSRMNQAQEHLKHVHGDKPAPSSFICISVCYVLSLSDDCFMVH